jgi:hypothetical protein
MNALSVMNALSAQEFKYENRIYDSNIKTVKFHLKGLPLSQPIVDLNSSGRLQLSFDDLSDIEVDYYYTIIHCDADWKPSDIDPVEYLTGFDEGEIYNYYYSGSTEIPYTHYRISLPNNEIKWKYSGNYLLHVYYYESGDIVSAITQRFMVSENLLGVSSKFNYPTKTEHMKTHHELRITLDARQENLRSPDDQLRMYVYQNGRWDVAVKDQRYDHYLGNKYYYDFPGKYAFAAHKEFRHLNNRYINSPAGDIMAFERDDQGFYAVRYPEASRYYDSYVTYYDINGQFVIQNKEEPIRQREIISYSEQSVGDTIINVQSIANERYILDSLCLNCEYVRVLFSLKTGESLKKDIYIFGGLTGWQLDSTFKMDYDPYSKAYFAEVLLKQGYYDYMYAIDGEDGVDTQSLEGNWHETENDYLVLVYDRHPFNRYDRLVAARMVNSSQ